LPAPGGPYSTNLAAFNGLSPNGNWKLYVLDDTYPDGGTIDQGWALDLRTSPRPILSVSQNGSALRLKFIGEINSAYSIQSTVDLLTWSDAGTVTAGVDGTAELEVQIDNAGGARF